MGDKMIKSAVALFVSLLFGIVGGVGGSAPALADDSVDKGHPSVTGPNGLFLGAMGNGTGSDCPSGMFCLWIDSNYNGARYQVTWQTIQDGYQNGITIPDWMDQKASALYNRTGRNVYVFHGWHCEPGSWNRLITNGQKLTAPGSAINDRIGSVQLWNAYPAGC